MSRMLYTMGAPVAVVGRSVVASKGRLRCRALAVLDKAGVLMLSGAHPLSRPKPEALTARCTARCNKVGTDEVETQMISMWVSLTHSSTAGD